MLHLYRKITAAILAAFSCGATMAPGSLALTTSPTAANISDAVATLTAKSGDVFKRDFVDWEKEVWGEPTPANANDKLHEGMQIGTGKNSWAEVSWPNVKTRAWANTVFAVAPNKRLVYLTGGEMLFRLDKKRKDKDQAYYIWTKVLQARIRGTTVLVQAKGPVTRFTVLEGVVDITNRLDHSRATIKPGVVYEIVGYKTPGTSSSTTYKPQALPAPKRIDGSVTDILYDSSDKGKTPLFQDQYSSSNIYVANSEALKNHPLVKEAGGLIDSIDLIQSEQKDLPGFNPLLPIRLADSGRLNKIMTGSVSLEAVPANADYFVGQSVGKTVKLPQSASAYLPPKGVILDMVNAAKPGTAVAGVPTPAVAPPIVPFIMGAPIEQTAASVATVQDPEEQKKKAAAATFQDDEEITQSLVAEFAAPAVVPATCAPVVPVDTGNPANGAFQTIGNYASNSMVMPTSTVGSLSTVSGGAVTTGAGVVTGAAGAIGGAVTVPAISPATAAITTTRTITQPVNLPINNLNLGGTLNSLTGR
jgi:hypothetical protein